MIPQSLLRLVNWTTFLCCLAHVTHRSHRVNQLAGRTASDGQTSQGLESSGMVTSSNGSKRKPLGTLGIFKNHKFCVMFHFPRNIARPTHIFPPLHFKPPGMAMRPPEARRGRATSNTWCFSPLRNSTKAQWYFFGSGVLVFYFWLDFLGLS